MFKRITTILLAAVSLCGAPATAEVRQLTIPLYMTSFSETDLFGPTLYPSGVATIVFDLDNGTRELTPGLDTVGGSGLENPIISASLRLDGFSHDFDLNDGFGYLSYTKFISPDPSMYMDSYWIDVSFGEGPSPDSLVPTYSLRTWVADHYPFPGLQLDDTFSAHNVDCYEVCGWLTARLNGHDEVVSIVATDFAFGPMTVPEPPNWIALLLGFGAIGSLFRQDSTRRLIMTLKR